MRRFSCRAKSVIEGDDIRGVVMSLQRADSQTVGEYRAGEHTAVEQASPRGKFSAPSEHPLRALSAGVPAWVVERASAVSPEVVAIASVYFVQGVLGLARLAVTFLLKDDFKLDPAEKSASACDKCVATHSSQRLSVLISDGIALYGYLLLYSSGLSSLHWLINPINGFTSNGIPLFGYHRRSYLVACGLLGDGIPLFGYRLHPPSPPSIIPPPPLPPVQVAVLSGLSSLPWLIKPIYGFISDGIPLFGYRRRSYLVACGLLGSLAWGALATVVGDKYSAVAMILLSSLSAAVSDVVSGALRATAVAPTLSPVGCWGALATVVGDKYSALAMILLSSLSAAVSDVVSGAMRCSVVVSVVVVDSMVVQRARGESQATSGGLQSLCWGSSAVGAVLSAYFSGSLIENYGTRFVFGVTALLPLITTAVGFYVPEERVTAGTRVITNKDSTTTGTAGVTVGELMRLGEGRGDREGEGGAVGGAEGGALGGVGGGVVAAGGGAGETWAWAWGQVVFLWETIRQPAILLPTAFIFLWQATPHSETAMFFFTTNELGFGPEFLGRVRLVTALASLAGVGVFNFYLKEVPLRKLFLWTNIAGAILGSTQLLLVTGLNRSLGISDQYFLLGDSLILTVLGQISFMPVLVLAARVCPPGIEATLFATLMSVSNGASVFGGVMGAGLTNWLGVTSTDFTNLPTLIAICNFSSLLVLPFLNLLPAGVGATSDSEEE
ncbi:unnamed protein product [Closterium sp. Yama58-4]|nr:unnamed protein product [Closterium sp. Yama58-4]